jgi:hypothetical protein
MTTLNATGDITMSKRPKFIEAQAEINGELDALPTKADKVATAVDGSDFEILSGIPIPEGRGVGTKYPWELLEVGQMFFVPGGKVATWHTSVSGRNKAQTGARGEDGKKYRAAKYTTPKGVEGVGVWRIK